MDIVSTETQVALNRSGVAANRRTIDDHEKRLRWVEARLIGVLVTVEVLAEAIKHFAT